MNFEAKLNSINDMFTIECEDIILREYRADDLDDLHALTWQPEIYEWLPGWNVPKEKREHWLNHYETKENQRFLKAVSEGGDIGQLSLRLGIVSKETGQFIGWCCTGIKEELPPPNREIMYAISRDFRGKGYTTQAAQGLIDFLFQKTNVDVLNAIALIRNTPSNKVIQKCGFAFHDIIEINHEEYNSYQLAKSDWEK